MSALCKRQHGLKTSVGSQPTVDTMVPRETIHRGINPPDENGYKHWRNANATP